MKDPCLSCKKQRPCDRHGDTCLKWAEWIFHTVKNDRNAVQMRITQYCDDGETISEKTTVSAKMLFDLEKEREE